MNKVAREVAEEEVTSWLDKKKVYESTRETYKDSIETLIDAVCAGDLTLGDDFKFTHTLLFPIEGENKEIFFKELVYVPRLNDKQLKPKLNGVKSGDADGRLNALVAALTSKTREEISNLDTADKKISMAIGIFFL